ncbi:MAG TPA: glutathione S-transferase family protein [Stellaceae bacterium]|nr:glutathione S-transferase family protein [Stellaceae bacterium]
MLELYHSINSVCAQKVRIVLDEKGLACQEHLMTLAGDQFEPAYMKLNPNAVVPTLVDDGKPVVESSVILYYLDEAFPDPPLMPGDPHARAKARLFNKFVDEYLHNSCMILSFATAFRARLLRMNPEAREAELAKSPVPRRAEYKRDVTAHGLQSVYVLEALKHHEKLLDWIESTMKLGCYLAGDEYSLAEAGVIPYIARLELLRLAKLWDQRPGVAAWWERMRQRPSTVKTLFGRMTDADWAPFRTLEPDPWPAVEALLKAA